MNVDIGLATKSEIDPCKADLLICLLFWWMMLDVYVANCDRYLDLDCQLECPLPRAR